MAELTGKAISELPESTTVSDSALIAVSQSGASRKMTLATLLGNLIKKTGGTATGSIILSSSNIDTSEVPSSGVTGRAFGLADKNEVLMGSLYPGRTTAGVNSVVLTAYQAVNGSNIANYVLMGVSPTGDALVQLSSPSAWRTALGLGTNGAFPLTIAQGGTGSTAVSSITTISSIATAASGFTINNAWYSQWGKLAMVRIDVKNANALAAASNITVATLVSGKRPVIIASGGMLSSVAIVAISNDGTVHILTRDVIAANATLYIYATYLLP
jgi:hypothetical protein